VTRKITAVIGPLLYDVTGGVATLTLNRVDAKNALNTELKSALRDTLRVAADDKQVRAVVVTGAGRTFCVGQDLREHMTNLRDLTPDELFATVPEHFNQIALALATMPKPVVAALNGVAAGAGASIAFACDFRIFADTAGVNTAFAGIGLSADTGTSWTLPRLVGAAKAMELLLRPATVPAAEALRLGLATTVVPEGELAASARAFAEELAAGPTQAYAAIKRAVAFSATHPLDESLAFEGEMMAHTGMTEDHRAAVAAFVAKEQPAFQGR
jgi:2-(1,2-epoxy-1,2-dihydrophenyl)acetyl-CoA isomerase